MKIKIYIILFAIISVYKVFGQTNKVIYWHDTEKTESIKYYHFSDSKNYLDITAKNNTAMSYVVYFPEIISYPMPIGDVNSPFILNERNKDSLILHFSGYRTNNLNLIIRKVKVSFTPDYLNAELKVSIVRDKKIQEIKLMVKRTVVNDEKVIEDVQQFCNQKNSFTAIKSSKELKCINYVSSSIVSATFLVGSFKFHKSTLIPISFDRRNFEILNNKKINIPDSIKDDFNAHDYSYKIKTEKEILEEKSKLKISYFLYTENKIMYYCFLYRRRLDDEFYHYGVQIPAGYTF